ncbi:MAG: exo-alpha-sialidase, partial [Acidobacteria bacterium]|nr:exo-alpha-sialidase [Acidobacteriota bacterium]NIM63602.1 exo-alpha-sialidase [Acidobacteriota bacterium]NIO60082.1 exo-alpha-sialidase [Acidobacteriota bacterium]NIQ31160.1 exo-alpha-sialidase [Acidobacteriota bacterium]NIQ84257.1 exo-alpha-sialidase [Acidobacteriota bacterium]
ASWFGGGYDDPGIHSVCVHPQDCNHITVGVSCGGVWVSLDGGATWEVRTEGMFAAYMPPERRNDPSIQDPHRVAQCRAHPGVLWAQHHNGMFRSTDGGKNWTELKGEPSVFGFAVVAHPTDAETAFFVPAVKDECRVPVDGKVVVGRTRDGGKTFDVLREGLPQEHAYDLVFRHALDIDGSGDRLAFGSTTGSVWTTDDGGDHWTAISRHLPPVYQVLFAA